MSHCCGDEQKLTKQGERKEKEQALFNHQELQVTVITDSAGQEAKWSLMSSIHKMIVHFCLSEN